MATTNLTIDLNVSGGAGGDRNGLANGGGGAGGGIIHIETDNTCTAINAKTVTGGSGGANSGGGTFPGDPGTNGYVTTESDC